MPLDELLNSDLVCPEWRDKINAVIDFCNSLTATSFQNVPIDAVIEWEGNIADSALWDVSGNGVAGSSMGNFALCMGQALTGATGKNPDGSPRTHAPNRLGKFSVMFKGSDVDFASIGLTGGTKEETLTALQSGLRTHAHPPLSGGAPWFYDDGVHHDSAGPTSGGTYTVMSKTAGVIDVDGNVGVNGAQDAEDPHNNLPPFYVVAKIIRYK